MARYDKNIADEKLHGLNSAIVTNTSFGYQKRVVEVDGALNLSSVTAARSYSSSILSIEQAPYSITLPTATTEAEATQLLGWHISIICTSAGARDVTVVRGDTSNDAIIGTVVASETAGASGITIGSNVVTFAAGAATEGDRVDIVCVAATDSATMYSAIAYCAA